jgi:hypothetical protein
MRRGPNPSCCFNLFVYREGWSTRRGARMRRFVVGRLDNHVFFCNAWLLNDVGRGTLFWIWILTIFLLFTFIACFTDKTPSQKNSLCFCFKLCTTLVESVNLAIFPKCLLFRLYRRKSLRLRNESNTFCIGIRKSDATLRFDICKLFGNGITDPKSIMYICFTVQLGSIMSMIFPKCKSPWKCKVVL